MQKKSSPIQVSTFLLQLCLGVFFLVSGISDITNYNSDWNELKRAFGKDDTLGLVTALVEIVMGAILALGLFMSVSAGLTRLLGIVLIALWAVYIFAVFIAQNFLEPNFLTWLYRLSWHSVILVSLWVVGKKRP